MQPTNSQELQAQIMLWVLKEERSSELTSLVQAWHDHTLALLPPCLAYLVLECGQAVSYRVALGWLDDSCARFGVHHPSGQLAGLDATAALEVAQGMLGFRRRRDRVDPSWGRNHHHLTNRTNRVAGRVLQLVKAQIRDAVLTNT